MIYKNSIKSPGNLGSAFELAVYTGNFVHGMRQGKGTMVWQDTTTYNGTWQDDVRLTGTLIMNNGQVFIGNFKKDAISSLNGMLLNPGGIIFQG